MKSQADIGNSGHCEKQSPKLAQRIFEFSVIVVLIVVLILLIRPAVQKAREKAKRLESANNLKQIGKAFQTYHETYGQFPPAVVHGMDGKPLYSWRVLLLPFLGEDAVYSQFKLDEPWDSPNNQPLLAKMPLIYVHPTQCRAKETYATHYQVFTGGGAIFDTEPESRSPTLKELDAAHRTNDTILVVEAADPVPWTKPQDLPFVADQPLPKLGGLYSDGTYVFLMADGTVHGTWPSLPEEMIQQIIPWKARK